MKGDENVVPFATYAVIALVVIFIALIIVTQGRLSLLFSAEALQGLFEPNKFTACVLEDLPNSDNCVQGKKVSAENVAVDCGALYAQELKINIGRVAFTYENPGEQRLGDRFEFLLAADHRDKLFLGYKGSVSRFSCIKISDSSNYDCEKFDSDSPLQFTMTGVRQGDTIVLHITAWKFDEQLRSSILSGQKSFADVLDEFYPGYITSVDIPVKSLSVDELTCAGVTERYTCRQCEERSYTGICSADARVGVCANSRSECPPTIIFVPLSDCNCQENEYKTIRPSTGAYTCLACPPVSSCSEMNGNDDACSLCRTRNGRECESFFSGPENDRHTCNPKT